VPHPTEIFAKGDWFGLAWKYNYVIGDKVITYFMNSHLSNPCRNCFGLLIAALAGLFSITAIHAQTFSIGGNFSTTSNPNGVWSYGWLPSLGGSLTLYTVNTPDTEGGGTSDAWRDPNNDASNEPYASNNSSGTTYVDGSAIQPSGWSGFAPGISNGDLSDFRFTAPATGDYLFNLIFQGGQDANPEATDTDVYVYAHGGTQFTANINGFGAASQQAYDGTLSLTAGQTVDIAVGYAASRENGISDNTNLQGTITVVPEPSKWVMLTGALGSLLVFHRRRR
jgi:hypothetical protein